MGPVGYGGIKLFEGPFVSNLDGAAFCSKADQHFAGGMVLGEGTREHEATGRQMRVRLTLSFRENFEQFGLGEGSNGVGDGVAARRWGSIASRVVGWGHGVNVATNRGCMVGEWWNQVVLDVWDQLLSFWVLVGLVLQVAVHAVGGTQLPGGSPWWTWSW